MFALSFRFPAGRYHATPWGRNVNEADVAWPPEPWRLLRALIATYWRKGDHARWSESDLAELIDGLAESLPEYGLPTRAIHAHTRHYMPSRPKTTLVFDAFLRLPSDATLVACWRDVSLAPELFSLAADLAGAMGYLGRAESWTECEALAGWGGITNCRPDNTDTQWDAVRMIAPLRPCVYATERRRMIDEMRRQFSSTAKRPLTPRQADDKLKKALTSKGRGAHTLPERLVDALTLDTADYQECGWSRPPGAREVVYARSPEAAPDVVSRRFARPPLSRAASDLPTVARFLLAGRPRPRIEDAVKIGELMRRAALARFGWREDESTGCRVPRAPQEISGRDAAGKPLGDPSHKHAFWLPEDADGDGWIDHVSVFVAGGMSADVRAKLDRITRLWLPRKHESEGVETEAGSVKEWRLALEGFGKPADFAGDTGIFAESCRWRSVTPFLAAGHLKASGYAGEVRRLLARREMDATGVEVKELKTITVGGTKRGAVHFHRFRSRSRERQPDASGALLEVVFRGPFPGPLCIGYGSHFGLGVFVAESARDS